MSKEVDNRVVEMRFDNAQFEQGVKQSMDTLDKLEESLKLEDAGKGIEQAAGKFNLLEEVATGALRRIGEAITDMGLKIAKSMTIDQITAGFSKYEQEVRAANTIMNATGDSIDHVNSELERLMWYTDETSYSYGNMVNNISKFTAQGIGLKEANSAMQGIANMAGLTGATIQDASHAMDGFAKAMAAGYMTLQNWKWIQTAHMETVATKEAFIQAAEELGVLEKGLVDVSNFTMSLKDKWLNKDVMMAVFGDMGAYSDTVYAFQSQLEELTGTYYTCSEAMKILDGNQEVLNDNNITAVQREEAYIAAVKEATGEIIDHEEAQKRLATISESVGKKAFLAAQQYRTFGDVIDATADAVSSSWKKIFSAIFGDAEQAAKLWTRVGEGFYYVFAEPLETVTETLKEWSTTGGWDTIFNSIDNIVKGIENVIGPFRDAFSSIFGLGDISSVADAIYNVSKKLEIFTSSMMLSKDASAGLRNILTALLTPLKYLVKIATTAVKVVLTIGIVLKALADRFLSIFSSTEKLQGALKKLFGDRYDEVMEAWAKASEALSRAWDTLKNVIGALFSKFQLGSKASGAFSVFISVIQKGLSKLTDLFIGLLNLIGKLDLSNFANTMSELINGTKDWKDIGKNIVTGIASSISSAASSLGVSLKSIFSNAVTAVSTFFKTGEWPKAGENIISGLLQGITNGTKNLIQKIKDLASGIIEGFKDVLGIHSPSLVMMGIGVFLVLGLIKGIESQINPLETTISDTIIKLITNVVKNAKAIFTTVIPTIIDAIASGLITVIKNIQTVLSNIKNAIDFEGISNTLLSGLKFVLNFIRDGIGIFKDFCKEIDLGRIALIAFGAALGTVSLKLVNAFANIANGIAGVLKSVSGVLDSVGSAVKNWGKAVRAEARAKEINALGNALKNLAIALAVITASIIALTFVVDNPNFDKVLWVIGGAMAALVAYQLLIALIEKINKPKDVAEVFNPLKEITNSITKTINSFGKKSKSKLEEFAISMALMGGAILAMANAVKLLTTISRKDIEQSWPILAGFGVFVLGLAALMHDCEKWGLSQAATQFGQSMLKLAIAINLMLIPIMVLKGLSPTDFINGGAFIAAMTVISILFMGLANKWQGAGQNLDSFTAAMSKLATAILLMMVPILLLKNEEPTALVTGGLFIAGATALFIGIAALLEHFKPKFYKNLENFSQAMILLAVAIGLMAIPVKLLSGETFPSAGVGLTLVGGLLLLFTGIGALVGKFDPSFKKSVENFSTSMILLAVAINLMAIPILLLSGKEFADVKVGLTVVGGLMILFGGMLALSNLVRVQGNVFRDFGVAMLELSASIAIMAAVIAAMSFMPEEQLKKAMSVAVGVIAFIGIFALIVGALAAIPVVRDFAAGIAVALSAALLGLSVAFIAFAGALKIIETVDPNKIKELLSVLDPGQILLLSAAAAVFGIAGALLAATLLGIGAAVLMIVPPITLFMDAFASLMQILNDAGLLPKEKAEDIKALFSAIASSIPILLGAIGVGIVDLAGAIVQGGAQIVAAITVIITGVTSAIASSAVTIGETIATIISTVVPAIAVGLETLLNVVINSVGKILEIIKINVEDLISFVLAKIPEFLSSLVASVGQAFEDLITTITIKLPLLATLGIQALHTLAEAIINEIPYIVSAGFRVMAGFILGLATGAIALVDAAAEALIIFLDGLTEAVHTYAPKIKESAGNLVQAIYDELVGDTLIGKMISAGESLIGGFLNKIGGRDAIDQAKGAGAALGNAAIEGVKGPEGIDDPPPYSAKAEDAGDAVTGGFTSKIEEGVDDAKKAGGDLGSAAVKAVGDKAKEAKKAGEKVAEKAVVGVQSRYKQAKETGQELVQKAADGIESVSDKAKDAGQEVGDKAGEGVNKGFSIDAIKDNGILSVIGGMLGIQNDPNAQNSAIGAGDFLGNLFGNALGSSANNAISDLWNKQERVVNPNATPWDAAPETTSTVEPKIDKDAKKKGSGSSKKQEKTIEELARMYKYGEGAIKAFAKANGDAILKLDETADVMDLSTKAIDALALHLYQGSEEYQKDLVDAEFNTEKALQHIQQSYNKVFNSIKDDITSLNVFSEREENEDPLNTQTLLENIETWKDAVDEYKHEAEEFSQIQGIPETLRRYVESMDFEQQLEYMKAFNEGSEDELKSIYENWEYIMEDGSNEIATSYMANLAGNFVGIQDLTFGEVQNVADMFNQGFANGIQPDAGNEQARQLAMNAVTSMREALQIASPSQVTAEIGTFFVQGFTNVLDENMTPMYEKAKSFGMRAFEGLRMAVNLEEPGLVQRFTSLGTNVVEGLAQGIEAGKSRAIRAAVSVAVAAYEAACAELDVESPSKKFRWIGNMVDEGFALGIEDRSKLALDAAKSMANDVYDAVQQDLDSEFTITPYLDLSDVRAKAGSISSMLENQRIEAFGIQNGSDLQSSGVNYNFTQNNYSPKALSRIDIYRQTKNQFSMMKGVNK